MSRSIVDDYRDPTPIFTKSAAGRQYSVSDLSNPEVRRRVRTKIRQRIVEFHAAAWYDEESNGRRADDANLLRYYAAIEHIEKALRDCGVNLMEMT